MRYLKYKHVKLDSTIDTKHVARRLFTFFHIFLGRHSLVCLTAIYNTLDEIVVYIVVVTIYCDCQPRSWPPQQTRVPLGNFHTLFGFAVLGRYSRSDPAPALLDHMSPNCWGEGLAVCNRWQHPQGPLPAL